MNPICVRNLMIGEGKPKICVPIVGKTEEEILKAAEAVCCSPAQLAEWRADWFEFVFDDRAVKSVLEKIREILGDMPILFTFRSKKEGGETEITYERYRELLVEIAATQLADMIDVEVFMSDSTADLMTELHKAGAVVVGSNHDFSGTPEKDEIVRRLCEMQEKGADIPKIAVMPQLKIDVMTLLAATLEMASQYAIGPIVTMSMSALGVSSRMCGEFFGSAITFATAGQASAPGQMEAEELQKILDLLHQSQSEKKA